MKCEQKLEGDEGALQVYLREESSRQREWHVQRP